MEHRSSTATSGNIRAVILSLVGAIAVSLFLVWLTYVKPEALTAPSWVAFLAPLAALSNTICATLLVLGWLAIRKQRIGQHLSLMLTALLFSALFFVSYVIRHYFEGDTSIGGSGWIKTGYLVMLASHVVGSVIVLFLLPITLRFAILGRFASHRSLNRWFYPIWLYVSVTGVTIYLMLRSYGS